MKNKAHSQILASARPLLKPAALFLAGILAALPAQAIVHLTPNASLYENRPATAPADTLPWDNVGKMTNAAGTAISGSVVSLHGKYALTARHVVMNTHVTFDGVTLYAVDTSFTPVTFETTDLSPSDPNYLKPDLKLFKLVENPGLEALSIVDYTFLSYSYVPLYIVGWGQGNKPTQSAPRVSGSNRDWDWGGSAVKRWGTASNVFDSSNPNAGYVYKSLTTRLSSSPVLPSEAATATYDSGCASFTYRDGQWYLVGISTAVSVSSYSRFSSGASRGSNYWVDLRVLSAEIAAASPEEVEPEPDPSTFEGWLAINVLDGAAAAADADPDGDGMVNLSEFAYGTQPTVHDGAYAPALQPDGSGGFVFRYQLSKVATGISVDILHSADVINWSAVPGTPVVVDDAAEVTVYELAVSPSPTTERFYTVKVTLDPPVGE